MASMINLPPPCDMVVDNAQPENIGVCGLRNLGNTSTINSVIQCLSNTPPLRHYFVSGNFTKDVNRGNPLGHEGKLAESLGTLLQLMWPSDGSHVSCVYPKGFKYQLSQYRPGL
jgi:ubiquitin carboxyl-terminal hydrolase 4/11